VASTAVWGRNKSVKNSLIVLVVITSVSRLVVPKSTTLPPVESHVYNSTSTFKLTLAFIEKWFTQAQSPEGKLVTPG
jgi:hypothetical protein